MLVGDRTPINNSKIKINTGDGNSYLIASAITDQGHVN